ncbi:MAG: trigger factor, partial [Deltaproteobacteria bacterium]
MKTRVEDISSIKKKLSVEVDAKEVEKRINKVYSELRKSVKLKGFRPGRVPMKILEARFGDMVKDEIIEDIIKDTFPKAVNELECLPLGIPSLEFDRGSIKKGKPFYYSAIVEVRPEFEVKDYLGMELEKPKVEVTEEMVEAILNRIREVHGNIVPLTEERPIKEGDYVVVNYQGFYKGKPLNNLKAENAMIKVGDRKTHPTFEASLVGLKKGDKTDISVDFEENYPNPTLAGKNIKFTVQIVDIKELRLAELSEEFIKEKFDLNSLQELKEEIKKMLIEQEEEKADKRLKEEVLGRLIDSVDIELPEVLIKSELEIITDVFKQELKRGGFSLEDFGLTEEKLKEDFRLWAEIRV